MWGMPTLRIAEELASTAKIDGPVTVEPGGALDVQGAKITGPLTAKQAARLQLCGASITGPVRASNGGRVVIGEGIPGCPANVIAGPLTVAGNSGTVVDQPNKVAGPSKLQ